MSYLGNFAADSTVHLFIPTRAGDGSRVNPSTAFEANDFRLYKNGSATQRTSEAGFTITSPFDSMVGMSVLSIDLSDNTDSGFYAAGNDYTVVAYPDETIDSVLVAEVVARFSIENRFTNVTQINGDATAAANAEAFFDGTGYAGTNNVIPTVTTLTGHTPQTGDNYTRLGVPAGASVSADIAENQADLNTVIGDTNELQTDWTNGGRLDLLLDAIKTVTDALPDSGALTSIAQASALTTVDTVVDGIQTDLSNATDGLGALKTLIDAVQATADAIEVDTGEIGAAGAGLTAVPWNASWDAEVQSEVNDALVALHLDHLIVQTGSVSNGDASATTTVFKTDLTASDDTFEDQVLLFTSGALSGQSKPISAYAQTNGQITVSEPLTAAPSDAVTFAILAGHVHPIADIQAGLSTFDETTDNIAGTVGGIAGSITTLDALDTAQDTQHGTTQTAISGLNDLSAAEVNAEVDTALSDYDGPTKAELDSGLAALNDLSAAQVNAEVDTALGDYDPPTRAELTTDTNSILTRLGTPAGADVSTDIAAVKTDTGNLVTRITSTLFTGITSLAEWLGLLAGKQAGDSTALTEIAATGAGSGTFDEATDSLEAIRDRGDAEWTTGSGGGGGGSAPTAAEIRIEMDDNSTKLAAIVADTNELQTDDVPGLIAALNDPTAAAISTAVWSAVTRTLTAGTNLNDISQSEVNAQVDAALADYDGPTKAELDAALAALNDLSTAEVRAALGLSAANLDTQIGTLATPAQVNAEIVDVVRTDTATELSSVPAASPDLHTMIQFIFMALRNKIDVTSSAKEVHNDAGTVIASKSLTDDGTTYSEGKAS